MDDQFITPEQYSYYQSIGYLYTGYVTGVGYAYTAYQGVPAKWRYCAIPPTNSATLVVQYMDSSPEMVSKSLENLCAEIQKRIVTDNGDGTSTIYIGKDRYFIIPQNINRKITVGAQILDNDVQIGIRLDYINQMGFNSSESVIEPLQTFVEDYQKSITLDLAKISFWEGNVSMGYSAWLENGFDANHYIPKSGPNAGIKTDLYKLTKKGNYATRGGKLIPKSANAASKIRFANNLKYFGWGLNFVGIGFTVNDMIEKREINISNGTDFIMGWIAFVSGWGWAVSGMYFLVKAMSEKPEGFTPPQEDFRQPYYFKNDNTYVAPLHSRRYNEIL